MSDENSLVLTETDLRDMQKVAEPTTNLDFGQALAAMKAGKRVRRAKWKPDNFYWFFDGEFKDSTDRVGTYAYILAENILANDWMVIP